MKNLLIVLLCLPLFLFSINDKTTISLLVTGTGETIELAKNNALRSALEQSFGVFISSKTEILNDNIKDEIVSISNGNIHNYKIISQIKIPEEGYAVTLEATVSLVQLSSFVKSRGINVEFQGQIFGANIKQMELNKLAEEKAISNLCKISHKILAKSLDFSFDVSDPVENKFGNYDLDFYIFSYPNKNYESFKSFFYETIKSISMTRVEFDNYQKINKSFFQICVEKLKDSHNQLFVYKEPQKKNKIEPLTLPIFLLNTRIKIGPSYLFNKYKNLYNIKTKSAPKIYKSDKKKLDAIYLRSDISLQKLKSLFDSSNELLLYFDLFSYSLDNTSSKISFKKVDGTNFNYVDIDSTYSFLNYNILRSYDYRGYGHTDAFRKADFPITVLRKNEESHMFEFNKNKRKDSSLDLFMDNLVYVHLLKKSFTILEIENIKEFKIIKK